MKIYTDRDLFRRDVDVIGQIRLITCFIGEFQKDRSIYWAAAILEALTKLKTIDSHIYETFLTFWRLDLLEVVQVYTGVEKES